MDPVRTGTALNTVLHHTLFPFISCIVKCGRAFTDWILRMHCCYIDHRQLKVILVIKISITVKSTGSGKQEAQAHRFLLPFDPVACKYSIPSESTLWFPETCRCKPEETYQELTCGENKAACSIRTTSTVFKRIRKLQIHILSFHKRIVQIVWLALEKWNMWNTNSTCGEYEAFEVGKSWKSRCIHFCSANRGAEPMTGCKCLHWLWCEDVWSVRPQTLSATMRHHEDVQLKFDECPLMPSTSDLDWSRSPLSLRSSEWILAAAAAAVGAAKAFWGAPRSRRWWDATAWPRLSTPATHAAEIRLRGWGCYDHGTDYSYDQCT